MNKKYVVYTALFGDYDKLREIKKKSRDCDYLCFTDQNIKSKTWTIIRIKCDESNHVLMNRKLKILPHLYVGEYLASLYIDANIKITSNVLPLLFRYADLTPFALPKHFERNCIYDEIDACCEVSKITQKEGMNWGSFLKKEHFPKHFGLGENNILFRKHNNVEIQHLMEEWWCIFQSGPYRDQLSLMYLIWKYNVPFLFMKESARNNNIYFKYYLHRSFLQNLNFFWFIIHCIVARRSRNIGYVYSFKLMLFMKKKFSKK